MRALGALLALALALIASACGSGKDAIRIAVLADCDGVLGAFYESTLAGAELPLLRRGGSLVGSSPTGGVDGVAVGGRPVELVFGCAMEPSVTAPEVRRLVEIEGADVVIGPDYPPNGTVLVDYAARREGTTFLVTSDETESWNDPGANVFRFGLDVAQQSAGLGTYAYSELGWQRATTIAAVDPASWGALAGIVTEFCAVGGEVADRTWFDTLQENIAERVARVPAEGVDGFVLTSDATSAGTFLMAYADREPELARHVIVAGSSLLGLETAVAKTLGDRLVGMVTAVDTDPTTASFRTYAAEFERAFPELAPVAGTLGHHFDSRYANAVEAVMQALDTVDGNLADGQRAFRAALAEVELDAAQGHIRLDDRRAAVGPVYLRQIVGNDAGTLTWKTIRTIDEVEASFGGRFGPDDPRPDRSQPPCETGTPPAWTTPQD